MLRVLVICGSTRGQEGYIPSSLVATFLEVVRLRAENRGSIEILLHDDSPLSREECAEEFCTVRPWPEIREMFATVPPDAVDLLLVLEHRECGAVFAEVADTLQQILDGHRPQLTIIFVCDSRATFEDAETSWKPDLSDQTLVNAVFCYDDGTSELPISRFVTSLLHLMIADPRMSTRLSELFQRWSAQPAG